MRDTESPYGCAKTWLDLDQQDKDRDQEEGLD